MKLLHTADWHLGKRLERFERLEEQAAVLEEICEIAEREQVDAVLIAGDLYDTYNPPIEATELFYKTLKRLGDGGRRAVIAIAGNHDSPDRIEVPDPLARECGILLLGFPHSVLRPFKLDSGLEVLQSDAGFVELSLPNCEAPLRLLLTPYANERRTGKALGAKAPDEPLRDLLQTHWQRLAEAYCDDQGVNLLMAHLFMIARGQTPPDEPEDEKPIHVGPASAVYTDLIPPQVAYTALGHLHRLQNMGGGPSPAVYASSPLAYSFAEADQAKHVVLLQAEPGQPVRWEPLPLSAGWPLTRQTFEDIPAALQWLQTNQDCYVELTIVTDDFIQAADRKALMAAHPRIIGPIPRYRHPERLTRGLQQQVDPTQSREKLFQDYFFRQQGVEASEEMMALFREVIGEEGQA